MVMISLTPEEAASLRDVLTSYISELRMEIAGTEAQPFRDRLKEQEDFLKGMVARLAGAGPPGTTGG